MHKATAKATLVNLLILAKTHFNTPEENEEIIGPALTEFLTLNAVEIEAFGMWTLDAHRAVDSAAWLDSNAKVAARNNLDGVLRLSGVNCREPINTSDRRLNLDLRIAANNRRRLILIAKCARIEAERVKVHAEIRAETDRLEAEVEASNRELAGCGKTPCATR